MDFTLQPGSDGDGERPSLQRRDRLPGVNSNVMLLPRDSSTFGWMEENQTFVRDPQGTFTLRGVKPGAYNLMAFAQHEGKRLAAREPIEVGNTDLEGVLITWARV